MNQFLFSSNIILEISLAALLVLGYVILRNSKRSISNLFFLSVLISSVLWVLANLITNLSNPNGEAAVLFWTKMTLFGPTLFSCLLIFFSNTFPENRYSLSKFLSIPVVLITIAILVFIPTRFNIESVRIIDGYSDFVPGPLYTVFSLFLLFSIIVSATVLIRKLKGVEPQEKAQIKTVLLGIVSSVIIGFLFSVVIPLMGYPSYASVGSASIVFMVFATAYAILKLRLLNIKLLATEIATYLAIIIVAAELFFSRSSTELVFRIVFLLFVIYAGRLLIKSMELEVARRKEIEALAKERQAAMVELERRNKNLAALQRISDIVLNEGEMRPMAQKILDEIPKQLESCAGALLSIVKDSQLVAYTLSEHQFSHKILSLVGGDLEKYSHPVKKDYNLNHAALVDKKPYDSDSLSDFISPPIPKTVALTIQKLIGAKHVEAFPLYAGGEPFGVLMFVFTDSKDQVHEKNHSIARAISDDMSLAIQRAQAYQKLKEANAYLADLDKLKDEFISMASHELNTPLAAIEGYLSMVLDEHMGKIDPKAKEYLNRAYDSSKRLAELILDLLNVSRIEQGRLKMKFAKTNFASLVESVVKELQLKADTKKLYLKLEEPKASLPETFCDPDRIREVFVNLIGNSIKFTEEGGITIKLSHPDDHIRAEVIDTGRGIAQEDQKKLFQKFSQVKREVDEHQGTGLGLYISKNFVELHKGRIGVTSEQGKGATFFFEIPILRSAPKEIAGAMLDKPVNATQIETGSKGVPAIVVESSKAKA